MNTADASIRTTPMRVLVVDDHPNTATTLARAISQLGPGLEVISATSGRTALEQVNRAAVDLLITDMMMPDMNGLELIEKLQAHPAGRPAYTILITAYDVPGLKVSARRLKVNETIIKPIRPEVICQTVQKVMEGWGQVAPPKSPVETKLPFKILVADDVPDNISLLSRYLTNEGYSLITAADGVETLAKTRAEMPDLILLDVNMPEKDGFVVLQEIRADPAIEHIPVIILTAARLGSIDMQSGLNLGADDYVTKPFDRRELLARIRTKLRVKEAEDIIRRRNRELNVLPEIGKELSARLDIDELTDVVLRRTVETLGAMFGHLVILDPRGPLHKKYRISNSSLSESEIYFPPLNSLLEQVKESRQSLIIENTKEDARWQTSPDDQTRSAIIVPMFGRRDLTGFLALTHEQPGYFKIEHQILLQAIVSQAVIAMENAQLYSSVAQEQRRLAAVLHSAADAILMFDQDGNLSLINETAEKLFTDYQTKLGQPLALGGGYDTLIDLLKQTFTAGKPGSGEIAWPDHRTFNAVITPIEDGGSVVILHDVTRFKDLERVKNEFIFTVSHDLKSPIGVIAGFSDLIPKVGPLNEEQLGFLQHIQAATANMNELVKNFLELARIDMGMDLRNETVNINELLSDLANEFQPQAEAKKQVFLLNRAAGQPRLQGDSLQLKQALRNLVGNAIKYTSVGGSIDLTAETEENAVILRVTDTGYGIPAGDLPFIFDRFYRVRNDDLRNVEGNGLGLAIVKSIVEKHAGQVKVESKQGSGSCFTLSLPLTGKKPVKGTGSEINI